MSWALPALLQKGASPINQREILLESADCVCPPDQVSADAFSALLFQRKLKSESHGRCCNDSSSNQDPNIQRRDKEPSHSDRNCYSESEKNVSPANQHDVHSRDPGHLGFSPSCVTLGKSLSFSELQLPHPQMEGLDWLC